MINFYLKQKNIMSLINRLKIYVSIVLITTLLADHVNGHGYMVEPPARNTLWRLGYKAPPNYNDNELFCGGIRAITANKGKCGICGDPYDGPRLHETGGLYAVNITTRNYFPGSTVDLVVEIVANHGGLFRFDICWRDDLETKETEDCFEELALVSSEANSKNRLYYDPEEAAENEDDYQYDYELDPNAGKGSFSMSVELPANKTCEHCVFRWHWTVANNWGTCDDGTEAVGCGYQEVYRNCADVSVSRRNGAGAGVNDIPRKRERWN